MRQLKPFTRLHRLEQRFFNWLDDITVACMSNGWFVGAVIVFSLTGTFVIVAAML